MVANFHGPTSSRGNNNVLTNICLGTKTWFQFLDWNHFRYTHLTKFNREGTFYINLNGSCPPVSLRFYLSRSQTAQQCNREKFHRLSGCVIQGQSASTRMGLKQFPITQASEIMHHAVRKLTSYWNSISYQCPTHINYLPMFCGTWNTKTFIR